MIFPRNQEQADHATNEPPRPSPPGPHVSAETSVELDPGQPSPGQPNPGPLEELDALGEDIAALSAHLNAATYRLLERIAEFDRLFDECGGGTGFRSAAHWLAWRTGLTAGAAREKVRVARALPDLPAIGRAMERGVLSYSQVRALTRVATAENEERLLELATNATAAKLERFVRAWRRLDRQDRTEALERERHFGRELTLFPDEDGSWVIRGRLDPEVGAVLEKALEAAADELFRGGDDAPDDAPDGAQGRADALGLLAEAALRSGNLSGDVSAETSDDSAPARLAATPPPAAHPTADRPGADAPAAAGPAIDSRADRYQVVLHLERSVLDPKGSGAEGAALSASLGDRVHVSAETARRIACDAGLVTMVHQDGDGAAVPGPVLDVGRRTRTVPAALRRALEHRDRGCRFPGCGNRRCDAHHIRHWCDGGETHIDNLVLLCRRHHRAVHEAGFRVEAARETRAGGEHADVYRFWRPDGRPLPSRPEMPAAPPMPAAALETRHREMELDVQADGASAEAPGEHGAPAWHGWSETDDFDLDLALVIRDVPG